MESRSLVEICGSYMTKCGEERKMQHFKAISTLDRLHPISLLRGLGARDSFRKLRLRAPSSYLAAERIGFVSNIQGAPPSC